MPRTTETAVRQIITTNLTAPQIAAFILDANVWVTDELVGKGISDARLEIIERYLACALVRLRDVGVKTSTIGDVSATYQVDSEVTDYLLRAAGMDPTGTVRSHFLPLTERRPAIFGVGQGFRDERAEREE